MATDLTRIGGNAAGSLRGLVERIERLNEEKDSLSEDIREVYKEAAGAGFDKKTIRAVIRERKLEDHERLERAALLQTYMTALGIVF